MIIPESLWQNLLAALPDLRQQMYFKSSLTALTRAMEDLVLAGTDSPLVIANYPQERVYRQEIRRYQQIARHSEQVYVLATAETDSEFALIDRPYETIPIDSEDGLAREWHLVIVSKQYSVCLLTSELMDAETPMEQARRFEGLWTFDVKTSKTAARLLLQRIAIYQPQLRNKIQLASDRYNLQTESSEVNFLANPFDTSIFAQRLLTYLQASQYKLLKAYRVIATQVKKERLINLISTSIRSSLDPEKILAIAVKELGQNFPTCRCLLYPLARQETEAIVEYEFVPVGISSVKNQIWSIGNNPLFIMAASQNRAVAIDNLADNPYWQNNPNFRIQSEQFQINSWLMMSIRNGDKLLGMLELHYCDSKPHQWREEDISLVEAIATQIGLMLTQARTYSDLVSLNHQLEALEKSQSNLIAIVGHELRTPLSTIRICLESLASLPEIEEEVRQTMLDIALTDAERLRELIQDFLTLSKLESGQAYRRLEPIQLQEVIDLSLSAIKARYCATSLPPIKIDLPRKLPLVEVDGEGLVEVLTKLLDNACKFTESKGQITIKAKIVKSNIELIVGDTGRGIDPDRLETIFNRFYQEEDSLRRTVGGTGLGLAICRQIIQGMGGRIWAVSAGKNQGSQFHFTLPIISLSAFP